MNFISREKIRSLCNIILDKNDFLENGRILTYDNLNENFNNPKIIFCFSEDLLLLKNKLHLFNNPFILISNNDDTNIYDNEDFNYIANHPIIFKWYAQNLLLNHSKVKLLPIGLADAKWEHGNQSLLLQTFQNLNNINKINNIYFYCHIYSNFEKRNECYMKLKDYIPFTPRIDVGDYFNYLATFKFAICPEGNGIDTHRLWECFYLKVIPIVLDNDFIKLVKKKYNLPMIILQDWNDIKNIDLNYIDFDNSILDFNNIKKEILDDLKEI